MSESRNVVCDWCGERIDTTWGPSYYHLKNCSTTGTAMKMIQPRGPYDYCSHSCLLEHVKRGFRPNLDKKEDTTHDPGA